MADQIPESAIKALLRAVDGMSECADCGAVITDQAVHDRFHSILSSHAWAIAILKNSHLGAEVHGKYDVAERIGRRKFDNWSADALAEVVARLPDGEPDEDDEP